MSWPADEALPTFVAAEGHEFYARRLAGREDAPFECLSYGCILVGNIEPGAFETNDGEVPRANWCLWCGNASTNEYVEEG